MLGKLADRASVHVIAKLLWVGAGVAPEVTQIIAAIQISGEGIRAVRHRPIEAHEWWVLICPSKHPRIAPWREQEFRPLVISDVQVAAIGRGRQHWILIRIVIHIDEY